jgi:hypothetical protein
VCQGGIGSAIGRSDRSLRVPAHILFIPHFAYLSIHRARCVSARDSRGRGGVVRNKRRAIARCVVRARRFPSGPERSRTVPEAHSSRFPRTTSRDAQEGVPGAPVAIPVIHGHCKTFAARAFRDAARAIPAGAIHARARVHAGGSYDDTMRIP